MTDYKNLFEGLNDEQLEAVRHRGNALLILAGAGAGKTRVITTKIAYLIKQKVPAYKILAVTFTNKAVHEMKERAIKLEPESKNSTIKTFHSFGAWFLRYFSTENFIAKNFNIYDDADCVSLLKTCFPERNKQALRQLQHKISRAKDDFLLPEDINEESEYFSIKNDYTIYQNKLRETGDLDFGDLIILPVLCLKKNLEIKKHLANYFNVIMVDEFQDTNMAQMRLLEEMYSDKTYLCVVGDDDQSIYKFRGASISNILSFQNVFPNTEIIKLEKNYRSRPQILNFANSIIKNNKGRLGKTLQATRETGIKPIFFLEANPDMEVARVIELISENVNDNKKNYSDWAVICRTNFQTNNFEFQFKKNRIPYKIVNSLGFYEREEIKDAIAILRFILNLKDIVSFKRIINKPAKGLGTVSQDKILTALNIESPLPATLFSLPNFEQVSPDDENYSKQIFANLKASSLTKKAKIEAEKFFKNIFYLRKSLFEKNIKNIKTSLQFSTGLSKFIATAIELFGLAEYFQAEDEIQSTQKLANLQELVSMSVCFDFSENGLVSFLETIALDANLNVEEETKDAVTLITAHGTKGLEFTNVIITGLEEGLFPILKNENEEDIEEERRLMYVACTRAKDMLFMTATEQRIWQGKWNNMQVSRFLQEADPNLFETKNYFDINKTHKKQPPKYAFPKTIPSLKNTKKIPNTKWKKGTIVYSHDYGHGKITRCEIIEGVFSIEVKFQTGARKVYLPEYNIGSLEIIPENQNYDF